MRGSQLKNIIKQSLKEYMGTGASGGNSGDGNSITSPRPYYNDMKEIEAYLQKSIYGGEGGHYSHHLAKNNLGLNRQKMFRFEGASNKLKLFKEKIKKFILELKEQAYPHATLTTQGQSIHRAPGVWEEDEEQLQEQVDPATMDRFNDEKISHQKAIAQIDIDIAREQKKAIAAQTQQQTQATIPQMDQAEKQLFDINKKIKDLKETLILRNNQLAGLNLAFDEIPLENEEQRQEAYEQITAVSGEIESLKEEIKATQKQRIEISKSRDDILKQKSQIQGQASEQGSQIDKSISDMKKSMNKIGKGGGGETPVAEILLKQYIKERANTNLMEQMDSYNEITRSSLKQFFEMFKNGKTNEEVLQHYAENGIQVPESYVSKAKKYFENYEKLKLELGFMDNEAKDFKKTIEPSQQEETKQLSTQLFKK
tara:strand:+ start:787 stop:2064 length:1278 start_codon:yes stop_codon:yes gene_type:complete